MPLKARVISTNTGCSLTEMVDGSSVSIRDLARALEREVKRVHEDVTRLIEWRLVERTEDGKVEVPFDVIHADFDLRAVA